MNFKVIKTLADILKESSHLLYRFDRKSLKIDDRPLSKFRYIYSRMLEEMSESVAKDLTPPLAVRGMTQLQREAFVKSVKVPGFKVPKKEIGNSQKAWKPLVLKLPGLKPVAELSDNDPHKDSHSLILLDPEKLTTGSLSQQQVEMLERLGLNTKKPDKFEVKLGYENWSVADVIRAVLPSEVENVTSFTQVGHIAHLNLKPETLPYKELIGEVILDKIPSVKTVVNKLNMIDNTYRNFSMELLAGEDNFITQTKEHNCVFELDFSKVYWNSRLSTEHQRITELVPKESVVYDVFAGVGPFAIPLAKKKCCIVYANDLNPASHASLVNNVKLNNIKTGHIIDSNLDGKDFILTVIREDLEKRLKQQIDSSVLTQKSDSTDVTDVPNGETNSQSEDSTQKPTQGHKQSTQAVNPSFVIMNLPAMAVEFLCNFRGILKNCSLLENNETALRSVLPHVYCYAFSPKRDMDTELRKRVMEALDCPLPSDFNVRLVRNVAPNKEMMCISFKLWPELVLDVQESAKRNNEDEIVDFDEPIGKRQKLVKESDLL
ncbi:hypothetical protein EGW08_021667 [Elysia chlorotica]|uniref:tRNA (guanine(37)-N1)-methyltransferase n=1 Tax=Elysia chlorotica TaxID=188477 RepID=A0A3S1AX44_ELYCH|nr:hypothetical protein EGW08_021667 [Elysia chlorotica]